MIGSPFPLWVSYGSTCTGPCPLPPHPPRPPRPRPAPPPQPCYCRIFAEEGERRVVREKRDPEQSASDQIYHESNALIVSQSVLPVSAVTREKTSHPFLTGTNNGTNGSPDLWVLACSSPLCRPSSMAAVILSGAAPAPSTICDGISGRSICDSTELTRLSETQGTPSAFECSDAKRLTSVAAALLLSTRIHTILFTSLKRK